MKKAQRFPLRAALPMALGLTLALAACHSPTGPSSAKTTSFSSKSYSVSVKLGGLSATSGALKAKSIIGDTSVGSVNVAVFDASSYSLLGCGTLSKQSDYWSGSITISIIPASVLFEATANSTSGTNDYYGTATTATLKGDGTDQMTISMLVATGQRPSPIGQA